MLQKLSHQLLETSYILFSTYFILIYIPLQKLFVNCPLIWYYSFDGLAAINTK